MSGFQLPSSEVAAAAYGVAFKSSLNARGLELVATRSGETRLFALALNRRVRA